jgi:hypothetical protein
MTHAHEYLLAMGYKHEHVEADWEDIGGMENGPIIVGNDAFDMYESDEDLVFICNGKAEMTDNNEVPF